jgi:hypothetical protein
MSSDDSSPSHRTVPRLNAVLFNRLADFWPRPAQYSGARDTMG